MKNMVIAEAMKISSFGSPVISHDEPVFTNAEMPDAEPVFFDEQDDESEYRVDWSDEYKLARDFLFGTKTIAPDFDEAYALLIMEAQSGYVNEHERQFMCSSTRLRSNPLAMHDLGRIYADGLGRDSDAEAAQGWYSKALTGFLEVASTTRKPYIQYRIGKMYAAGLGTEQDYTQAAKWFGAAAEKNHKYAQYSLGGLYYRGQGVAHDYEKAFDLYEKSAVQGNAYANYELAKMLRDGIGCTKDAEQAKQYFNIAFTGFQSMESDRSDDRLQYRLGQMLRDGIGTKQDAEHARIYFEASARLGNPHAQYALAKIIIETGDTEKIAEAVSWLSKSADGGNQFAQYSLGKFYYNGEHVEKDIPKAVALLTLSAEQKNQYAQYALGKLFLDGEAVPKDVPAALRWLTASAEQGNQFAQYTLGKSYLDGAEIEKDVSTAIRYLTESAEQGNQFSQYQLGKLHLLNRDIPHDREQAVYWFTLSAEQGNEFAQFFLDHMDDWQNPSLLFSASQLLRGIAKLFEDQQQMQTAQADHIDRKRMRELRQKMQAQGHARDEQIQNY